MELKPCVFCQCKDFICAEEFMSSDAWVECTGCGARGPVKDTVEEAREAWNTRTETGWNVKDETYNSQPTRTEDGDDG